MQTVATPLRLANCNVSPRREAIHLGCDARFPDVAHALPVFVCQNPRMSVTVNTPECAFLPRIVTYDDIRDNVVAVLRTQAILSFLVNETFDALDMADLLSRYNFSGRYIALSASAPDLQLVRREVAAQNPTVDFDICRVSYSCQYA